MKFKIALSTSLAYEHNWDPLIALDITKSLNIKEIQIYIGDDFIKNENLSTKIVNNYGDNLNFIFHAPVDLNNDALNPININTIKTLVTKKEAVVYHHDYKCPIKDSINIIKKLNSQGITVLLENFYKSKEKKDVLENITSYKELLKESKNQCLGLYPLIDIPRLFIKDIASFINPIEITIELLKFVKKLNSPLYLHLIDTMNSTQDRNSWCVLGEGYIPYDSIFNEIKLLNIEIPLIVLEYEQKKHINDSLRYLEQIQEDF